MTKTTETKFTFGQALEMWLAFDFDYGHKTWDDFMAHLSEQTGREFGPNASARLRRYIRKTYGGTRGF